MMRFPLAPRLAAIAALLALPAAGQLSGTGSEMFVENDIGVYGPLAEDEFGASLAAGDFNGDGADDLATGVPHDDNSSGNPRPNSGIVIIRYGNRPNGLANGVTTAIISQAGGGSPDPPEEGDSLGHALAAGDFDGDGYDDLAVGIPWDRAGEKGSVQVHYGNVGGLALSPGQWFHQDSPGIGDTGETRDTFGFALAVGDFDHDGYDDLAIGVPTEDVPLGMAGEVDNGGMVQTLYGSALGLDASRSQTFHQNVPGMDGDVESQDLFGWALAAGDFDGDLHDDLAIGVRGENDHAGGVQFLYGGATGLGVTGNELWTQNDPGMPPDDEEQFDDFGSSLAAGDFNGDSFDDVAAAAPGENLPIVGGEALDAGAVQIFRGSASGLVPTVLWTEDSLDVPGVVGQLHQFGFALAAGDFARDGTADLAIGVPGQNAGHGPLEGWVVVLPGRAVAGGLTGQGSVAWRQGVAGLPGPGEQGDEFGSALTAADFDGNGFADLAIGAPRESTIFTGDGAEWAIYGTWPPLPFADGFETGNTNKWAGKYPCGGPCA